MSSDYLGNMNQQYVQSNGERWKMRISPRQSGKLCVVLILLVLAASDRALAQEPTVVKLEGVGLSSERLEYIGKIVQQDIDDKRIAGAVSLVIRHGQVAWFRAQEMSDREAGKPMRSDSIFRICSMAKPITSVAAMILYEDGKFMLDDPISNYLPEFKNPKVLMKTASGVPYTIPASREITIRDLLRHTSGLTYQWNSDLGPM